MLTAFFCRFGFRFSYWTNEPNDVPRVRVIHQIRFSPARSTHFGLRLQTSNLGSCQQSTPKPIKGYISEVGDLRNVGTTKIKCNTLFAYRDTWLISVGLTG